MKNVENKGEMTRSRKTKDDIKSSMIYFAVEKYIDYFPTLISVLISDMQ